MRFTHCSCDLNYENDVSHLLLRDCPRCVFEGGVPLPFFSSPTSPPVLSQLFPPTGGGLFCCRHGVCSSVDNPLHSPKRSQQIFVSKLCVESDQKLFCVSGSKNNWFNFSVTSFLTLSFEKSFQVTCSGEYSHVFGQ